MRKSLIILLMMFMLMICTVFGAVTINTPLVAFSTNATTATWQFKANSTLNLNNMTFFMSNSAGTNTTLFTNATAGVVFSGSATFTGYADGNYTLYARGGNTTLAGSLANIELDSTSATMTCTSAAQTTNPVTITCTSTELSTCKIAQQSLSYNQMSEAMTSPSSTSHSVEKQIGDGSHTWYASCVDRSGNAGTTTITFTMDQGAKIKQVISTAQGTIQVQSPMNILASKQKVLLILLLAIVSSVAVVAVVVASKGKRKRR